MPMYDLVTNDATIGYPWFQPYLHLNFSEGSVLGDELEVLVGEDGGGVDTAHGVVVAVAAAHILTPVLAADPSSTERCCWCCGPPPPHHHSTTAARVWRVELLNLDIATSVQYTIFRVVAPST